MTFSPLGLTTLLSVFDMPQSLSFYRDVLGFEVVSASPEVETNEGRFSHWVWLRFGAAEIMLNTQYDSNQRPTQSPEARSRNHGDTCLYIGCPDVDVAYEALKRRGLEASPPTMAPYGLRLFRAKDPDGYVVVFQGVR